MVDVGAYRTDRMNMAGKASSLSSLAGASFWAYQSDAPTSISKLEERNLFNELLSRLERQQQDFSGNDDDKEEDKWIQASLHMNDVATLLQASSLLHYDLSWTAALRLRKAIIHLMDKLQIPHVWKSMEESVRDSLLSSIIKCLDVLAIKKKGKSTAFFELETLSSILSMSSKVSPRTQTLCAHALVRVWWRKSTRNDYDDCLEGRVSSRLIGILSTSLLLDQQTNSLWCLSKLAATQQSNNTIVLSKMARRRCCMLAVTRAWTSGKGKQAKLAQGMLYTILANANSRQALGPNLHLVVQAAVVLATPSFLPTTWFQEHVPWRTLLEQSKQTTTEKTRRMMRQTLEHLLALYDNSTSLSYWMH